MQTGFIRFVLTTATALALLSFQQSAEAEWNIVTLGGRRYVPIDDVAQFYKMQSVATSAQDFQLSSRTISIKGRSSTGEIYINGIKYILCFPVVDNGGRPHISSMDVTKIIEPVLRPSKIKNPTAVRTIILDAGHGGHDSGATGRFGREKDFALDVALRAKALLQSKGFEVKMTRSRDVFVPLEERAQFANRHQDAVFVSIHFNQGQNKAASGIETFFLAPRGVPSAGATSVRRGDMSTDPGHARDAENIALATAVHSALLKYIHLPDRGIKHARFHVIRQTRIPSVLIEGGFIDNPIDGPNIAGNYHRQMMAQAITDAVSTLQYALHNTQTNTVLTQHVNSTPLFEKVSLEPKGSAPFLQAQRSASSEEPQPPSIE